MIGTESTGDDREALAASRSDLDALREVIEATVEMAVKVRSEAATTLLRRAGALLRERDAETEQPFRPF